MERWKMICLNEGPNNLKCALRIDHDGRHSDSHLLNTGSSWGKVPVFTLEAWHEDDGNVLWWLFPVAEPPWVGTPLDEDWLPDYYTHWTRIEVPEELTTKSTETSK